MNDTRIRTARDQEWIDTLMQTQQMLAKSLEASKQQLNRFYAVPENNVFSTVEDAYQFFDVRMREQAKYDCRAIGGSIINEYSQEFFVDNVAYIARLEVQYDHYQNQFYFVEWARLTITPKIQNGEL